MSASLRTRMAAKGLYLWACIQDMPLEPITDAHREFVEWAKANPALIGLAIKAQFNLFDAVNRAHFDREPPVKIDAWAKDRCIALGLTLAMESYQ